MKNIYKIFLAIFILCMTCSLVSMNNNVIADDYGYGYNCGDSYEVDWINDSGKFDLISCHASFDEAKNKMKELGGDHVVRHASSLSPTKIIAMNSGNAYSYPARSNRDTMKIFQHVDIRDPEYKDTYVANHYELNYRDTERYLPKYNGGMIEVTLNGFDGYTDLENTDLIPSKFLDRGLPIFLGGNDKTSNNEQPFLVVVRRNFYTVEENNGYRELVFYYHRSYCKPSNTNKLDEEHRIVLGPAPDELATGMKYYSSNGYDFYTSPSYDNKAVTYYPYYQFLPLRSKTNLNANDLNNAYYKIKNASNSKMKDNGQLFIDAQDKYGINGLLLYAMAAHESSWGTSSYALNRNNLFGWNAVDENPDDALYFDTLEDGIFEHAGINLRLYIDITDFRFFSSSLGNKGSGLNVKYASDPYWGMKIAAVAYQIDKVNSSNNILNDFNRYQLSLINEFDIKFHSGPSTDSKTLYTTQYGPYYQKDFIVIKLGEDGSMTKIQSTNPIKDGDVIVKSNTKKQRIEYDFDQSVAYVETRYLNSLNHIQDDNAPKPEGDYISQVNNFNWDENNLYIDGLAYVPGISVNDENGISNTVVFYNSNTSKEFLLNSSVNDDGSVTYSGSIDVSTLDDGEYFIKIVTKYSKYGQFNNEFNLNVNSIPDAKVVNTNKYIFGFNSGRITFKKTQIDPNYKHVISMLNKFILNDDLTLELDGLAFRENLNYTDPEIISHKLQVINSGNNEVVKEFDLETYEVNNIDLNDGFKYNHIGYRGVVDLSELTQGGYYFKIVINNGDEIDGKNISDSNVKYMLDNKILNGLNYKIANNYLFNYRLELDIEKNDIDYSKVYKKSQRNSVAIFEKLGFSENYLNIYGVGYMHRLDFASKNNPLYNIYLINENGEKFTAETKSIMCKFDYNSVLNSEYDLTDACYEASYDLSQLPIGDYELYFEISLLEGDVEYYDIFNFVNIQKIEYKSYEFNDKVIKPYISEDRYRMHIKVEDKAEVLVDEKN